MSKIKLNITNNEASYLKTLLTIHQTKLLDELYDYDNKLSVASLYNQTEKIKKLNGDIDSMEEIIAYNRRLLNELSKFK